jgi:aryl-alcohol dehydrogenase-like predicted oxidoreductase
MELQSLGDSHLKVSPICLGTMHFGTKTDQAQSERLLDAYLSNGGNFVDTSNNYAFWMKNVVGDESETVLGRELKALLPGASFKLIPGAGHLVMMDQPLLVLGEVLTFLTS